MIQREELEQILNFVASRWSKTSQEPDNKAMESLPNDFWMNSIGGKTAKGGHWVTTIMYTENESDAASFICGLAGKHVQDKLGLHMTSMDLIDAIPNVMKPFDKII
ncbi:hypothetical protein N9P04_00160 [bacterium]|nr:hypothetical protein [bacterium]